MILGTIPAAGWSHRLAVAFIILISLIRVDSVDLERTEDHILSYKLCLDTVPETVPAATVRRSLLGHGAHRGLQFDMQLARGQYVYLQPLPAIILADVYQLSAAAAVRQGPRAHLHGLPDVESIARWSQPSVLAIFFEQVGCTFIGIAYICMNCMGRVSRSGLD